MGDPWFVRIEVMKPVYFPVCTLTKTCFVRKWTSFLHNGMYDNNKILKSWEIFRADLWFRASKMATRELDPPQRFKNRRDFWVCCHILIKWFVLFCNLLLTQFSIMTAAQLPCSRILASWDSGWENRCFCLWCSAIRISHWAKSTWLFTTKPCFVGTLSNSTKK